MYLSSSNVLADASSVVLGGTSAGTSLTDINVLRRPFVGDPYYTSKYGPPSGGVAGDCYVAFTLPAVKSISLLAVVRMSTNVNIKLWYEVRNGGAGGALVASGIMTTVSTFSTRVSPKVIEKVISPVTGDYVVFYWSQDGSAPQPATFRRFWAGTHLSLTMLSDTLVISGDVIVETSDYGQRFAQDLGMRREVSFSSTFQTEDDSVLPISSEATALSQLFRAGLNDEVLLIASDLVWNMHGHFLGEPKITKGAGPVHSLVATVREY